MPNSGSSPKSTFSQVTALVVTDASGWRWRPCLAADASRPRRGEQPQSAELAFLTGGAYRGRGVASLLLRHLTLLGPRGRPIAVSKPMCLPTISPC